jgi:glycosyltransferase involved in cell wall biosynthesis
MKVAIAALSAPAQQNGVSRHAINLVRALLCGKNITAIHLLAGTWQSEMFRDALSHADERLHTHWFSLPDVNLSRLLWYLRELPLIARQLEADVIHLTFPAPISSRVIFCPIVLSLHDLYPFEAPKNFGVLRSTLARKTVGQSIRKADAIACVSTNTRDKLAERFPVEARKAVVIPNVVESDHLPSPTCEPELLRGRSFILCVAQHRWNKNVPLAIRVFEKAIRTRVLSADSRLVVVGIRGPETGKIQSQIRELNLHGKVLLRSGIPDVELRWCYENCVLLLAPSTIEGFGLPIAEGILAGCRIVCSDIPAFREVGGDCCRFVPWNSNDVEAYAAAIRETLELPKPHPTKLPHLSAAGVGRQYSELYQSLFCPRLPEFGILQPPEGTEESRAPIVSHFR